MALKRAAQGSALLLIACSLDFKNIHFFIF
jgi:hypothetical protein